MAFALKYCCIFLCVLVFLPIACYSDEVFFSTRATFYGSAGTFGTPYGACGYGDYGKTVNNGEVCGVSKLYKNGTGCGACYQVKCKHPQYCNEEGTTVVVTDFAVGHETDFILSFQAFAKLARTNMAKLLIALWVVDAEYKRVPFRFQVSGSAGVKWVEPKKVIPSEWKAGIVIDTAVQLT